jgi:hypothetical protein
MTLLLFVLEILFIATVIAFVPALPELRLRRARVFHNEREQKNTLRCYRSGRFLLGCDMDFVK